MNGSQKQDDTLPNPSLIGIPQKTKMDVNRSKTQDENEIMKKHKR